MSERMSNEVFCECGATISAEYVRLWGVNKCRACLEREERELIERHKTQPVSQPLTIDIDAAARELSKRLTRTLSRRQTEMEFLLGTVPFNISTPEIMENVHYAWQYEDNVIFWREFLKKFAV